MKLVLVAAILLAAHTAAAKASPAVPAAKALLDAQLAAINAHDAKAFAATTDAGAYAIFPTTLEGSSRATIETAAKTWLGSLGKTTVKLDHPRFGEMGDTGCAWISAEIVATGETTTRWRVTEMVAPRQPTDGGGDPPKELLVLAAHISEPIDDKVSLTAKLPALPAIPDSASGDGFVDAPRYLAGFVISADPAVTLVGSAPREFATGKAAVAAKLREYKGLAMSAGIERHIGEYYSIGAADASVWHVEVTYKVGGKPVVVPYRVLVIILGPPPAVHGDMVVCAVHFSVAQR